MIFAKFNVRIPTHIRFVNAGPAAVGYWASAVCYSRGEELDGVLPARAVGIILGVGPEEGHRLAARLCEPDVGLFSRRDDGGYEILKYAEHNETKAQILKRRAGTRKRVNAHRNGKRNADCNAVTAHVTPSVHGPAVPGSGSGSGSGFDLGEGGGGEGEHPAADEAPPAAASGTWPVGHDRMGMCADTWIDGVRSVTGKPFAGMTFRMREQLVLTLEEHCPKGTEITEWARGRGEAFAKSGAKNLNVHAFADFMNRLDEPAAAPSPHEGPRAREERRRRDREMDEAERNLAANRAASLEALKKLSNGVGRLPGDPTKKGAA